ncbi:hypothetical protein [Arthrobacter sp. ISL-69]|uniref:hypothetical protein n=1 Tax=Arthrobacter sp. ISL-69 TaxID=2819113 RepID=UPI001BE5C6EC|nr:hypothetical protein [Arthrobacter sp. ISL-69]MBT2537389.1 hypothetical protein [Arthrobacter sp. ISL-69]
MRKNSSGRKIPGQVGVAAATVAMAALVVGLAQIPGGAGTAAGGAAPLTPPAAQATTAEGPAGPAPATADPAATAPGPAATPTAGQPPGGQPPSSAAAPPAAPPSSGQQPPASEPVGATPDAQAVQRVTDSCSRRLQSDAANSGIVSGTVVPRPYSLVSVEYAGIPHRSTAGPGLESYDVEISVTTRPLDGPAQTDRRVCRVYDYDSHVDWLPAG